MWKELISVLYRKASLYACAANFRIYIHCQRLIEWIFGGELYAEVTKQNLGKRYIEFLKNYYFS